MGDDAASCGAAGSAPPEGPVYFQQGEFVELGFISTAFGIRGEVKVVMLTDEPKSRFRRRNTLYLQPPYRPGLAAQSQGKPPLLNLTVESARPIKTDAGGATWAVKFAQVLDRNQAEELRQFKVRDLGGCSTV